MDDAFKHALGPNAQLADTGGIDRFLAEQRPATPCIVIDLDIVRARYRALRAVLQTATILYAVKANPAHPS